MLDFVKIRNLFVKIFKCHLVGIIIKNRIYKNFLLSIIPFCLYYFILDWFKYDYFYCLDDTYFYSYKNKLSIAPIILEAKCRQKNYVVDMIPIFNKYQYNFPFWIILNNEKIKYVNVLDIKFIDNCQIKNCHFDIQKILNLSIINILVESDSLVSDELLKDRRSS